MTIVPSYDHVRYTAMGYKTKNYVELTRTSDADGVNSISDVSPLGKAIMGKLAGDEVTVKTNGEEDHYRIISVSAFLDSSIPQFE